MPSYRNRRRSGERDKGKDQLEMKKQTPTLIDRIELPDEKMISVLRSMTPAKRLETAFYLARLVRKNDRGSSCFCAS